MKIPNRKSVYTAVAITTAAILLVSMAARRTKAEQKEELQHFGLSDGATIDLSGDWLSSGQVVAPPPAALSDTARPLSIYELQAFEDPAENSALQFGLSNNPFLGRNPDWLANEMHHPASSGTGLVSYLASLFFPPPAGCDGKSGAPCEYAPALPDFYSYLLAGSPRFHRSEDADSVGNEGPDFFLVPMEEEDIHGFTFFVFEAQGQKRLGLGAANHFNLPDSIQGAQGDFFWAIGAPSPFPFVRDPSRKNVSLVHVVYAGITPGPDSKPAFLNILRTVRFRESS